ncbi:hypothetical protein LMBIIBHN_04147 [Aeromonas salmonicida]
MPVRQRPYAAKAPLIPQPDEADPPAQQPLRQRNMDRQQGTLPLFIRGKDSYLYQGTLL